MAGRRPTMILGVILFAANLAHAGEARSPGHRPPIAENLWQLESAPPRLFAAQAPLMACEELATDHLPHARNAHVQVQGSGSRRWCRVTIDGTSGRIWVGLPLRGWNGRFLGLGGGGFLGGDPEALEIAVSLGFAAGATDGGNHFDANTPRQALARLATSAQFVLGQDGRVDTASARAFAYEAVHEMTLTGRALAHRFYGAPPRYSYFSGCSTGGRQGQESAQRYPRDYDGILSGAPAVSMSRMVPAGLWPQVVLNEQPVGRCKFEIARQAVVAECDVTDGVVDGIISNPPSCRFDPQSLAGRPTPCGVITRADADAIARIWRGPRRRDGSILWHGNGAARGTEFDFEPRISVDWARYFLGRGSDWSPARMTHVAFEEMFSQSENEFASLFDARGSLATFARAGGKTIIWHGLNDSAFPAEGSLSYVERIRQELGSDNTDNFLRFYLAPGVGHCGGGLGPRPRALLASLLAWVEEDRPPGILVADNRNGNNRVVRRRPLCPYPMQQQFKAGSPSRASSFECASAHSSWPDPHAFSARRR